MPVQVSLNTSANPPVTVNPTVKEVNNGNQTITWNRAAQQTFVFKSLSGLPNPPFSNLSIGDTSISITDTSTGGGTVYPYTIVVTYNGSDYSTSSSGPNRTLQSTGPSIRNK